MNAALSRSRSLSSVAMFDCDMFAIQEHRKVLSTIQSYAIKDATTGEVIGVARETIGALTKLLRWVMSKHLLPTLLEVREKPDDSLVFSMSRSGYIFRSRVEVRDSMGALVGYFKSKVLTIGGGFHVYDKDDNYFADVKGNLIGFNYRFVTADGSVELGQVTKKIDGLAGLAREIFFTADNYLLCVNPELGDQPLAKMLLLAAALAVDLIFKSESSGLDFDFP
jgi:uncharacterized protein YxjI